MSNPQAWKLVPVVPTKEMCNGAPSLPAIHAINDLPLIGEGYTMAGIQNMKRYTAMLAASPTPPASASGLTDVAAERQRQIDAEGWTPEHDDEHDAGTLAAAGACYALRAHRVGGGRGIPENWPFDAEWWKPKNQRRDLVRAAALIIAEIDRLDRLTNAREGE